jgi:DNA-binding protein HU-beta
MTKEELITKVAKEAEVTKAQAHKAVSAFFDGVTNSLKKGKKVSFIGFGTFSVGKRKARMGRNPRTGAPIRISASKVPKFKAGKQLKDAVQ